MGVPVLSHLWQAFSAVCDKTYKRPGVLPLKTMKFDTYMVECPETAQKLRGWSLEKTRAEQAIDEFLSQQFMAKYFKISGPVYQLDETGHVDCVRPRDWMPITLVGWEGRDPGSNWLVPEGRPGSTRQSEEGDHIRETLENLPPVPSFDLVKELINWPDLKLPDDESAALDKDFSTFSRGTDYLLRPFGFGRHAFIEVPAASELAKYPVLQERVENWEKPDFLKPVSRDFINRLEAREEQKRIAHTQKRQLPKA